MCIAVTANENAEARASEAASSSPAEVTRTSESTRSPREAAARDPAGASRLRDPGRYRIVGEHGRGGLGKVSRAHDIDLGRDVAIKELISRGNISELRFLREALITARLEHPGIVPVHEAGRWPDGTPFYAMKLVAGRSLRDLIAERATVDGRVSLLHHVIAVADAIAYAHGRNIIHRDLKPSNVIVGDFGETVVIDWGLAKDLSATQESTLDGGPFCEVRDDGLTSAGTILGTPAYMAPEQARGESVDQRADVFAIGAMLWELCTLERLPPGYTGRRRRILRRSGLDQDLTTIVEKCLEPDPGRRYRDAGALAADLKAFKAGARIAARTYSLWALLSHWTRRHRALALSTAAILVLGTTGILLYIADVTTQRNRADLSEQKANRAGAAAEASLNELTLRHAQLLLTTDPSAVIDVVTSYKGANRARADQIVAEAQGRGAALLRTTPHTDNIVWLHGSASGSILSMSIDGTIAQTTSTGTSVTLYTHVSPRVRFSYSPQRNLLAFTCDPRALCFLDVSNSNIITQIPEFQNMRPMGVSFSPDGTLLTSISDSSLLTVFNIEDLMHPKQRLRQSTKRGLNVKFLDNNVVSVGNPTGIEFVDLVGRSEQFVDPGGTVWDANPDSHRFARATKQGEVFILSTFPFTIRARRRLCNGPVAGIQFVLNEQGVGYACKDGLIGIWDPIRNEVEFGAQLEGHADLIAVSASREYLIAAGGNGSIAVVDRKTKLVATYRGHGFRLTSLIPPTLDFPFLLSGDARGAVRKWPLPTRVIRTIATPRSMLLRVIFAPRSTMVIATSWTPEFTTYSSVAGLTSIPNHEQANIYLERSLDGRVFATYGFGDLVEIWDAANLTRTKVIHTAQQSVPQLSFVKDTDDIVTSGRDGRIIRWSLLGDAVTLASADQPTERFTVLAGGQLVVFSTVDGNLWRTGPDGKSHLIRPGAVRATCIISNGDDEVYVGFANGEVIVIDVTTWRQRTILRSARAIRDIVLNSQRKIIAVATNDDLAYVGSMRYPQDIVWTEISARASHLVISASGLLLAACSSGGLWIYASIHERWLFLDTGIRNLGWITASDDGTTAAAVDSDGNLLWIDLSTALELLNKTHTTTDTTHEPPKGNHI